MSFNSWNVRRVYYKKTSFKVTQQAIVHELRIDKEYKIIETIGQGNFGKVYRCVQILDNQEYAIKISQAGFKRHIEHSEARNEVQSLAKLHAETEHPNIVRYFTGWIENSSLYMVSELCTPLKTLTQEFEFKCLLKDILSALSFMHSNGLVHMDIKKENIVCYKTHFKIADLGLCRNRIIQDDEDIHEGDARYLAPEIIKNLNEQRRMDLNKADIYSFGAVIYEMMTKQSLSKSGDEWHAFRYQAQPIREQYSQKLLFIVQSMLQPDPALRPTADQLLFEFYIPPKNYITFYSLPQPKERKKSI